MKPIYLLGFMGCGKTTVGTILAKELGFKFIDLDEEIALHKGMDIPTIFEKYGEKGFREVESEVLRKQSNENTVISTGGGIITVEDNIIFIKENGISIYLESAIEVLYNRVHLDQNRPNAINRSIEELNELFISRKSTYEKADYTISVTDQTPKEVTVGIINCLKSFKGGDSRNK